VTWLEGLFAPRVRGGETVPQSLVAKHFDELTKLGNSPGATPTQRALIREIIDTRAHDVNFLNSAGQPHVDRNYPDKDRPGYDYDVHYYAARMPRRPGWQDTKLPLWERLGDLVHEMTHVAVDRAYGKDFINYSAVPRGTPPPPNIKKDGKTYRIINELERQTAGINPDANRIASSNLSHLKRLLGSARLSEEERKRVDGWLDYGRGYGLGGPVQLPGKGPDVTPSLEYDAVLNQVYLWLIQWRTPRDTDFFKALEEAVGDALSKRAEARKVVGLADETDEALRAVPIVPELLEGAELLVAL